MRTKINHVFLRTFEFRQYKGLFAAGATHNINAAKRIDGQIGFTQRDIAIGIFTFTAMVMSEYEYFYSLDKKKFEGFIHYWRVISYHVGQMDGYVTRKSLKLSETLI